MNGPALSSKKSQSSLNVVFCADRGYLPHLATAIVSLFETNENLLHRVFVLSTDIQPSMLRKAFSRLNQSWLKRIELVAVSDELVNGFHVSQHVSHTAYLRFFLGELLPEDIDSVLYLDCDLVVIGPLNELAMSSGFLTSGMACLAVEESTGDHLLEHGLQGGKYFNSGVMLCNIRQWRLERLSERLVSYAKKLGENTAWWDQDSLNLACDGRWGQLDDKFNYTGKFDTSAPVVAHFAGNKKPWMFGCDHPYRSKYLEYRKRTSFYPFVKRGLFRLLWERAIPRHSRKKVKRMLNRLAR